MHIRAKHRSCRPGGFGVDSILAGRAFALAALVASLLPSLSTAAQETLPYRSAAQGYTFSYPATWRQVPGDVEHTAGQALERVLVQAPDGFLAFISVVQLARRVEPDEVPSLQAEMDSVMLRIAAQARGEVVASRLVSGEGQGKENALYYEVAFPRQGVTVESRQYILFSGDRQFIIALEADAEGHRRHQGVLDLIFSTFEIQ